MRLCVSGGRGGEASKMCYQRVESVAYFIIEPKLIGGNLDSGYLVNVSSIYVVSQQTTVEQGVDP